MGVDVIDHADGGAANVYEEGVGGESVAGAFKSGTGMRRV
jgi:hypothetical protein